MKEKTHATRKTRHKAPGSAQEVSQEDKGLLSDQEQALPVRSGSGQSRRSLCQARSPREEAAVSPVVDSARRRGRPPERHHLRSTHPRFESRGCDAGPQGSGRHRREGCRGVHATRGKGQGIRAQARREKKHEGIAWTSVIPNGVRGVRNLSSLLQASWLQYSPTLNFLP